MNSIDDVQMTDIDLNDDNDTMDSSSVHKPQHLISVYANGTPESICKLAKECNQYGGLDQDQTRAFQILVAKFVLGFIEEAEQDSDYEQKYKSPLLTCKE